MRARDRDRESEKERKRGTGNGRAGGAEIDHLYWFFFGVKPRQAHSPSWLATRLFENATLESTNWGWMRVEANQTTLQVEFVDAVRNTTGDDTVWITRTDY